MWCDVVGSKRCEGFESLVLEVAWTVLGGVGVLALGRDSACVFDVLKRLAWKTSVTAEVVEVTSAVH